MDKRHDHESYSTKTQMANRYMKDACNKGNEQRNNEVPIDLKKKKSWIVLTPGEGMRGKKVLNPIDESVNLNALLVRNLSLSLNCTYLLKEQSHCMHLTI